MVQVLCDSNACKGREQDGTMTTTLVSVQVRVAVSRLANPSAAGTARLCRHLHPARN